MAERRAGKVDVLGDLAGVLGVGVVDAPRPWPAPASCSAAGPSGRWGT